MMVSMVRERLSVRKQTIYKFEKRDVISRIYLSFGK
jgi:hypothetical protein